MRFHVYIWRCDDQLVFGAVIFAQLTCIDWGPRIVCAGAACETWSKQCSCFKFILMRGQRWHKIYLQFGEWSKWLQPMLHKHEDYLTFRIHSDNMKIVLASLTWLINLNWSTVVINDAHTQVHDNRWHVNGLQTKWNAPLTLFTSYPVCRFKLPISCCENRGEIFPTE